MKKAYSILKIFTLILISFFLFSCKTAPEEEKGANGKSTTLEQTPIEHEEKFGGFYIKITIDDFNELGFNYGDSVTIKLSSGFELTDIPYYSGYYSDTEAPLLVAYPGYPYIKACYNNGGDMYIMANLKETDTATITLHEEQKYLDIQEAMNIRYSDEQGDQSDEVFGNFRAVNVGKLKENILYRSASPCDNQHNRAAVVDRLIASAGVNYIINLSDNAVELVSHINKADFNSPYFLSIYNENRVLPLSMSMAYRTEDFEQKLAAGLRGIIESDGPYLVHCVEGKDRTGYVCMILEALASASYEEIIADYMITYDNYYQVNLSNNPSKYNIQKEKNIDVMLKWITGDNVDITTADYEYYAKEYLKKIGLSDEEISSLVDKLVESDDNQENPKKTSEELSDDLVNLMNSYFNDNSRYYSEYVYYEVGDIKIEYSIKTLLDRIYIEEMFDGLHIIKEEDGYVYLYYYDKSLFLHRRFISMKDDFLSDEVTEEDQIEDFLFDPFSIDKTDISYDNGTYTLKGLISSLDLGIKNRSDFYIDNNDYYELKIKEENSDLYMTMNFKIHIEGKIEDFTLIYSISRKRFVIRDTSLIYEEEPTHIEEVTKMTDLTESFIPTVVSNKRLCGYYLVHLDKGLYYFDIEGKSDLPVYGEYTVYLCDKYYKQVEVGQVINYRAFKEGNNQFFEVFESGDYYLMLRCPNRDDYYYQLKKVTYPLHEKKDLSNLNGSITGLFDYYEVVYQAENFGSIILTNNGESDVYILFNDNLNTTTHELSSLTLKPGVTMSIPLYNDEEKDFFYITSRIILPMGENRGDASYDFQISAEVEKYDNEVYDITLDSKTTFSVHKSGPVKGRIVISEAGYYTITSSEFGVSGHIEDGNDYIIWNGLIDLWYLEPGTYIVDFIIEGSFFNKLVSSFQLEKRNIE